MIVADRPHQHSLKVAERLLGQALGEEICNVLVSGNVCQSASKAYGIIFYGRDAEVCGHLMRR